MKYHNGYTSRPHILAKKQEIRRIKIDIERLMILTLDYANEISNYDMNKGKLPKPIEHIFKAVENMKKRMDALGLEIKRERNKISDANPTMNRKTSKVVKLKVENFTDELKDKLSLNNFVSSYNNSSGVMTLSSGFNSLVIHEIKDIWDKPQNTSFARHKKEYVDKIGELILKSECFGLERLSEFLENSIEDFQVNTDTDNLYIVFTTNEDSTFLVYFNF